MDTNTSNENENVRPPDGGFAGTLKTVLRSLRHRNYRLFFGGQGLSLIGTWMQQVSLVWLVARTTHSELLLGVVAFSGQILTFLLSPLTGVLADRWNKHRVLLLTQALMMVQAAILAALTLTDHLTLSAIIALSMLMGMLNSLEIPVRQSFVVELVGRREDLPNAIALNSFMFNGARLVGPSLAILLIGVAEQWFRNGEGACFAVNAVSYLAVLAALLAMKIPPRPRADASTHVLEHLKEGFRYCFGFKPIRAILLLLGLSSLVGMPYAILMPFVVHDVIFHGRDTLTILTIDTWSITLRASTAYYTLVAATGVGALLGALFLASRTNILGLSRLIALAPFLFGAALIGFALSPWFWLSLGILVVAGFSIMVHMASSNTILQTITEDTKRGRVMSFYAMAFMGTAPIGSLVAGALATGIGASRTLVLGGLLCITGAIVFAWRLPTFRALIHPVYVRLGLLDPPPPMPGTTTPTPLPLDPRDS